MKYFSALAGVLALGLLLAAACGGVAPEDRTFDLTIVQGELQEESTLRVKHNDVVTLRVDSDEAGEVHLHGYDLDLEVASGAISDLVFTANATGRFDFELHRSGEEHSDEHEDEHEDDERAEPVRLGSLEVQPR